MRKLSHRKDLCGIALVCSIQWLRPTSSRHSNSVSSKLRHLTFVRGSSCWPFGRSWTFKRDFFVSKKPNGSVFREDAWIGLSLHLQTSSDHTGDVTFRRYGNVKHFVATSEKPAYGMCVYISCHTYVGNESHLYFSCQFITR